LEKKLPKKFWKLLKNCVDSLFGCFVVEYHYGR